MDSLKRLHQFQYDFNSPAQRDATRVAPRPVPIPAKPLNPPKSVSTAGATIGGILPARQDATAVAAHPLVANPPKNIVSLSQVKIPKNFTPPPVPQLRSITPEQIERNRHYTAQRQAQEIINRQCASDPFASQVNGYHQIGQDWNKIGPSPLEIVATVAPAPRVVNALVAGVNAYIAIKDPSTGNIVNAVVSGLGVGVASRMAHLEKAAKTATTTSTSAQALQRLQRFSPIDSRWNQFENGVKLYDLGQRSLPVTQTPTKAEASQPVVIDKPAQKTYNPGPTQENIQRMRALKLSSLEQLYQYYQTQGSQSR